MSPAEISAAKNALGRLPVRGRAPKAGYSRGQFGLAKGWPRTGRGCDTRDQILARDLTQPHREGCNITAGTLHDPCTGKTITLTPANPKTVEIEHVVALGDAWQKGAQQWTPSSEQRSRSTPPTCWPSTGPATPPSRTESPRVSWRLC